MSRVIATCGHDISNEYNESFKPIIIKEWTVDLDIPDLVRTKSIVCYCKSCEEEADKVGLSLKTPEEESDWLSGRSEYPGELAE